MAELIGERHFEDKYNLKQNKSNCLNIPREFIEGLCWSEGEKVSIIVKERGVDKDLNIAQLLITKSSDQKLIEETYNK